MTVKINADTTNGAVITSDTSGEIELQAGGTKIATVKSTGLEMASGIYLGGTAAANLLNDYEEGTYTVQGRDTSGNNSSTTVTGYYTKIGNLCFVVFRYENINTTGLTSGDLFTVNLPFNSRNIVAQQVAVGNVTFINGATNDVMSISMNTNSGDASANFSFTAENAGNDSLTVGDITSGTSDIRTTFTYMTE